MTQDTAIAVRQEQSGQLMEYSPQDVMNQVALIQKIMAACMKKDEHYGVIPGCGDKPTLLKPGAEKLLFTFRIAPDYEIETVEHNNGHREYRVKCRLTHIVSGAFLGSGLGCATTLETKWRYRNENTGKPVPKEYWDSGRNPALLGGEGFTPRKITAEGKSQWVIYHQVEHPNPADYYNTCLKMSKKRALVDAVLTCTAASDIFTQDLEEMKENGLISDPPAEPKSTKPPVNAATASAPTKAPEKKPEEPKPPAQQRQPRPPAREEKPKTINTEALNKKALNEDEVRVKLGKVYTKNGTTKKGKTWIRHFSKAADGIWYSTFDIPIGEAMKELAECDVVVKYKEGNTADSRDVLDIWVESNDTDANAGDENREAADNLPF